MQDVRAVTAVLLSWCHVLYPTVQRGGFLGVAVPHSFGSSSWFGRGNISIYMLKNNNVEVKTTTLIVIILWFLP